MENDLNPRDPVVGVVKPMVMQSSKSDSISPPQIINQEQLIMVAQQMGNSKDISALTEAISNLNTTLLRAVQENLTTKESQSRPHKVEKQQSVVVSESEDEFKDAQENGFVDGERISKEETASRLEAVLKVPPPPPPPPPPPMEMSLETTLASSNLTTEERKAKTQDENKPLNPLMDQLKKVVEGGATLRKIQRPEKKPEIRETQEFTIKVKLRSVTKSDSLGNNENIVDSNATAAPTETLPRLRRSPSKTEGDSSFKPPTSSDNILSQVTEARKKMRKVRKTEQTIEDNDEMKTSQLPAKLQPPKPNEKPKKRNTSETNEGESVTEVTVDMESRRKSLSSFSDNSKPPQFQSSPMEDHIKNFFLKKKPKTEENIKHEASVENHEESKSQAKVEYHSHSGKTHEPENGFISEKATTIETLVAPNAAEAHANNSGITKALLEDTNPAPKIDSNASSNHDDKRASTSIKNQMTCPPKPSKKPKPMKATITTDNEEIGSLEKHVGESFFTKAPLPPPPPPPPPPAAPTNMTVTETSFSSQSFQQVNTVSASGSTKTTFSSSYSAKSSMQTNGHLDKGELLSAIKGFNKNFLKKVTETRDEPRTSANNSPIKNEMEEQIKQAIQKLYPSINGDGDSDSECCEDDSEWETNDNWEE